MSATAAKNTVGGGGEASFSNPFAYLNEVGSGEFNSSDTALKMSATSPLSPNASVTSLEPPCTTSKTDEPSVTLLKDLDEAVRKERAFSVFGPVPHKLPKAWAFWYLKPPTGSKSNFTNYESLLKKIGDFETVEEFWAVYLSMKRPNEIPTGQSGPTDISLFLKDIHPTWEDANNAEGGKLMLRLRKHENLASFYYEALLLLLVGGAFPYLNEICGIVFSIRSHECILSIWTRNASDMTSIQSMREYLKSFYGLSANSVIEYKPHHYAKPAAASTEAQS